VIAYACSGFCTQNWYIAAKLRGFSVSKRCHEARSVLAVSARNRAAYWDSNARLRSGGGALVFTFSTRTSPRSVTGAWLTSLTHAYATLDRRQKGDAEYLGVDTDRGKIRTNSCSGVRHLATCAPGEFEDHPMLGRPNIRKISVDYANTSGNVLTNASHRGSCASCLSR
jgi:hypothetical protein